MPILPKKYSVDVCNSFDMHASFDDVTINNIERSFTESPNYEKIVIVHDSSLSQDILHEKDNSNTMGYATYDSWIFDGTEDEQTVGYKYLQMYPYKTPVLKQGDYVCWDYYKDGSRTVWFVVALETQTVYEQIAKIKMCTNEIRFADEYNNIIRVPCIFDDKINSQKSISLSHLKYINGITSIWLQINKDSEKIKPSMRFLFGRPGDWTAFRASPSGVNNFMNRYYDDNYSATVMELTLEASYVNEETDDIINGIADTKSISVSIDIPSTSCSVGASFTIKSSVFANGNIINMKTVWSTNNSEVVSVSSSGIINCLSPGIAIVRSSLSENSSIYDEVQITVQSIAEKVVVISPTLDNDSYGIQQGDTQLFECYLYVNGDRQADVFDFSISNNVPKAFYSFKKISGNSFSIKNIMMYTENALSISCVSGQYNYGFDIVLKGAW